MSDKLRERHEFTERFTTIYAQGITFMQMRRGKEAAYDLSLASAAAAADYISEVYPDLFDTFVKFVRGRKKPKGAA